jgi:hypothetical protein
VAAVAAPAAAPSRSGRPLVSLSATPAHLTLLGRVPQTLVVHNDGAARVRVATRIASFSFDSYGNAAIAPSSDPARSARRWLNVRPRRLVLAPGAAGKLRVLASMPRRASAGDHHALVLLSTVAPGRARVSVRTRLGVLVFARVPGRIVRRLTLGRVSVSRVNHRRFVVVSAFNRGNVTERLQPGELKVILRRRGRVVALATGLPRDLLPHTSGFVLAALQRTLRGRFTAVARIDTQPGWTAGPAAPPLPSVSRTARLRL